ncbi:uncharacterized protein SCHCODRAFT_02637519 [Schizophyllum commune H4-8]|uniref:uncharacterized protein n=1 Tax=Schizophyllum commune (strain H4-8 / FGSC 9210) TaxID=578458 RepID=UPI00215E8E7A|nr:uncharacterized protein SCHCODRAFT_02637519 [Schizophyllum commune H4-8]KAI5888724.1 hypothetical protein SCHCODRAFT_02637519 [Schizophyllum commune H4-8]
MKENGAPHRFELPITTWAAALMEFEPRTSRAPYSRSGQLPEPSQNQAFCLESSPKNRQLSARWC